MNFYHPFRLPGSLRNSLIALSASACFLTFWAGSLYAASPSKVVKTIFDTEMSSDCDGAGALVVLNHLADCGEAEILACVADAVEPGQSIAATISAINTYYGRPQIPIGTYQSQRVRPGKSKYTTQIRDGFSHNALPDDQQPRALDVYRRALADAPDGSVTIISLGFLVNLRDLLESKPDAASPLSGVDLARQKVTRLVVVGGRFKPQDWNHTTPEYNFGGGEAASAPNTQYVVEHWPTEILFSGLEIGQGIATGPVLASAPPSNPLRRIYELFGSLANGRSSWCQIAVLAAVRDPELYWDVKRDGYCQVTSSGLNTWAPEPHRGHSYLAYKTAQPGKVTEAQMAKLIGDMMVAPPSEKSSNGSGQP